MKRIALLLMMFFSANAFGQEILGQARGTFHFYQSRNSQSPINLGPKQMVFSVGKDGSGATVVWYSGGGFLAQPRVSPAPTATVNPADGKWVLQFSTPAYAAIFSGQKQGNRLTLGRVEVRSPRDGTIVADVPVVLRIEPLR